MTGRRRRHDVSYVTGYYPPHLGGLENVAQTIAEMVAENHDVRVITTACGSDGAPARETRRGVPIRRFAGVRFANTPFSLGLMLGLLTVGRRSIVHVHIAQAFIPEVVLLTSSLRRGRYVAHFHVDVDARGPFGVLLASYKRWVLGPCLRHAAAVIALSEEQVGFLIGTYGVRQDRITVIPNGVAPDFYALPTGPAPLAREERPVRLLNVGRLDPGKGLERLLDAMVHVASTTELVIVGDGVLRKDIVQRAQRLGLTNVRFAGRARGTELLDWYRWADVFVMPSDKEGMPLVVLEAMAAGLAVVATDSPGTRDVVQGVGLLADLDPKALGAAIDQVAGDPALLSMIAVRCAARSTEFRWEAATVQLERLYDSVAAE